MIIPANFSIATLFPCCAILPSRPAEPLIEVPIEEKTSDCTHGKPIVSSIRETKSKTRVCSGPRSVETVITYAAINNALVPCIVVDVDCDPSEGGYLRGKLIETRVVLSALEKGVNRVSITVVDGDVTVRGHMHRTY